MYLLAVRLSREPCLRWRYMLDTGILQVPQDAKRLVGKLGSGADIRFLTKPLAYQRILSRLLTRSQEKSIRY